MTHLVFFGDSYAAGHELYPDNVGTWPSGVGEKPGCQLCFPRIIGKDYEKTSNLSKGGASIGSYIEQLREFDKIYKKDEDFLLVVELTQHLRHYWYDEKLGWISLYPGVSKFEPHYKEAQEKWEKEYFSPMHCKIEWYKTISMIQGYCKDKDNIKDVYIESCDVSPNVPEFEHLIDRNRLWTKPVYKECFFVEAQLPLEELMKTTRDYSSMHFSTFTKTDNFQKYYNGHMMHPNAEGHVVLAKAFKEIIDKLCTQ